MTLRKHMQKNPTLSDASKVGFVTSFKQGGCEIHFSFFTHVALKLPLNESFFCSQAPTKNGGCSEGVAVRDQ